MKRISLLATHAVAAAYLCVLFAAPTQAAPSVQPAQLTEPQVKALLLTTAEAARATGFTGVITKNVGNMYCNSSSAPDTETPYSACQNAWKTTSQENYPGVITLLSYSAPAGAKTWLSMTVEIESSRGGGWTVASTSPTQAVIVYRDKDRGQNPSLGVDIVLITRLTGTTAINAQCERTARTTSIAPLTRCAKMLTAAQTAKIPS